MRGFFRCSSSDWDLGWGMTFSPYWYSEIYVILFCNGKYVLMHCLAQGPVLTTQEFTNGRNAHSQFSNSFVNFLCPLGSKNTFFHCNQKHPISWVNHHIIGCWICSSDLSWSHDNRMENHLDYPISIFSLKKWHQSIRYDNACDALPIKFSLVCDTVSEQAYELFF